MPSVVVLLLERCDNLLYFFFSFNGISMGNEAASIVLEETSRFSCDALVRILDGVVIHSKIKNTDFLLKLK